MAVGAGTQTAIGLTQGLLERLDAREVRSIMAHEISHLRNNDMRVMSLAAVAGRVTRLLTTLGQILLFINLPLLLFGRATISWLAILLLMLAPTLSALLQMAISRRGEFVADQGAVALTNDATGMALALKKLDYYQGSSLFGMVLPGSVSRNPLFSSHPLTMERVKRLAEIDPQVSTTRWSPTHPSRRVIIPVTQRHRSQGSGPASFFSLRS